MKDFVPREESLELKQLGFELDKDSVFGYWNLIEYGKDWWTFDTRIYMDSVDYIEAPLFSQAFRFFRKKYRLCGYVEGMYPWCRYYINSNNDRWEGHKERTYEEAELECIRKLIQIVKQKQ